MSKDPQIWGTSKTWTSKTLDYLAAKREDDIKLQKEEMQFWKDQLELGKEEVGERREEAVTNTRADAFAKPADAAANANDDGSNPTKYEQVLRFYSTDHRHMLGFLKKKNKKKKRISLTCWQASYSCTFCFPISRQYTWLFFVCQ